MTKLIALLSKSFKRKDETLSEFAAEYKQLTAKDLDDFRRWFEEDGQEVDK